MKQAESIADQVARLVRQRALAVVAAHDEALKSVYSQIAEGVRRDLRAAGFSVAEVRAIIEKHFGATFAQRRDIVEQAITAAAREARTLPQDVFDALYMQEAPTLAVPLDRPSSPRKPR